MKNIVSLSLISLLFLATSAFAEPSSEIPARREFPENKEISPCQDFHEYICSIAEKNFKLRPDRNRHTFSFSDSHERILESSKNFFKNINAEKKLSPRSLQFKDYYMSCMNTAQRKMDEKKHVADWTKKISGLKDLNAWLALNTQNLLEGKFNYLDSGSDANLENSDNKDFIFMGNFQFLPEKTYYDKPEVVTAYKDVLKDFFKTVYPKISEADAQKKADSVLNFEVEFSKTYPVPAEMRQLWSQKRYIDRKEFLKKYAFLHLEPVFKKIPEKVAIRDLTPENFKTMEQLITKENLETLKDVMLFRTAAPLMDEAYPEFFQKMFVFKNKFLGGPPERPDLQERCTTTVKRAFYKELDAELMGRLFPNFDQAKFVRLAEKVRASIVEGVKANTWLSEQSKAGAIDKMSKARLQLVKPQNDREWDFVPLQKYSNKHFLDNAYKLQMTLAKKEFAELKDKVNKDRWGMGPLTINAYYNPSENKFVMPMGILQYPFYDGNQSELENFGAVGAVIGHELGHGIDDEGAKFDTAGNLSQWMSESDVNEFKKRGQRMIEQFNKIGHNGQLTLGENVADLVGLTFAYHAAFKENPETPENQRKFYASYARLWCGVELPKTRENQLKTDPHALGFARINEQVKQQPAFAKSYQCKKGDPMTLSDKDRITIW